MPYAIHEPMWRRVENVLTSGIVAVTHEIFVEMSKIDGFIRTAIDANQEQLELEIGEDDWDSNVYSGYVDKFRKRHKDFISEYIGGRNDTICLTDISIVALAKTLAVPLVQAERKVIVKPNTLVRRIPNICEVEGVDCWTFDRFILAEYLQN